MPMASSPVGPRPRRHAAPKRTSGESRGLLGEEVGGTSPLKPRRLQRGDSLSALRGRNSGRSRKITVGKGRFGAGRPYGECNPCKHRDVAVNIAGCTAGQRPRMPAASSPVGPRPGCPCKTWAKAVVSGKNSLHALTRTRHGRRTTKKGVGWGSSPYSIRQPCSIRAPSGLGASGEPRWGKARGHRQHPGSCTPLQGTLRQYSQ